MPWQLRPHKVCRTAILSIRVHLIRLPEKKVSKSRVTLMAFSNRLNLDIFQAYPEPQKLKLYLRTYIYSRLNGAGKLRKLLR